MSQLSKILEKNRIELAALQTKSASWFDSQAREMGMKYKMTAESLLRGDAESKGNRIIPGNMYMFLYDPKHKETLPYYDTFPLVFPFMQVKGGFYGINLHYLPYKLRATLLDRLLEFRTSTRYNENTRLRLQWQLLSSSSKFAAISPCVKHYLYEHVRSPFKAIHSADWATAMMLPVERFHKATTQQVWANSIRTIKGR